MRSTSIMCQGKDLGVSYSYNYSFLIIFGKYSSYSFEGWVPKQVKIKKKKKTCIETTLLNMISD